jgi:hypothetical protein
VEKVVSEEKNIVAGAVASPLDWRNIINQKLQSLGLNQAVMGKVNKLCSALLFSLLASIACPILLFPRSSTTLINTTYYTTTVLH